MHGNMHDTKIMQLALIYQHETLMFITKETKTKDNYFN